MPLQHWRRPRVVMAPVVNIQSCGQVSVERSSSGLHALPHMHTRVSSYILVGSQTRHLPTLTN